VKHDFDEDAVCVHCGFDGAEWWHWKHQTYEGKASDAKQPSCTEYDEQRRAENCRRYLPVEEE
jgi:hypothetical protein